MTRSTGQGRRRGERLVVAGALALAAACGGSGDDDETASTTTTTEAVETTTTEGATGTTGDAATADLWAANAQEHRGDDGSEFDYECPPDGTLDAIWGTEVYTDDSSVCSAAVHVGLITVADGGTVTIEVEPGQASYEAGVANEVTSEYFRSFEGSFSFPDAPPGSGDFEAPPSSWSQSASGLQVGDSRTLECSPGGSIDSVWGTDVYTADSSICTAAVLEGLITVASGGEVTVDVVEGRDSYTGSEANGVTSLDYPAYEPSFELADQP